jgi:hypothetical protein
MSALSKIEAAGFTIKISKGGNVVNVGNIVSDFLAQGEFLETEKGGFSDDSELF